jgi:hypothetical protein
VDDDEEEEEGMLIRHSNVGLTHTTFNLSPSPLHNEFVTRAPRAAASFFKAAETGGEFSLPTAAEWSAI